MGSLWTAPFSMLLFKTRGKVVFFSVNNDTFPCLSPVKCQGKQVPLLSFSLHNYRRWARRITIVNANYARGHV